MRLVIELLDGEAFYFVLHRCVVQQLATRGVKILLGKLAVGRIKKTKTKNRHSDTEHTLQSRITGCSIVFLEKRRNVNLECFLIICKRILCYALVLKKKKKKDMQDL